MAQSAAELGLKATDPYRARLASLEAEHESWRTHHAEVQHWIAPYMGRFLSSDTRHTSPGRKRHQHIFNTRPALALRVLSAGMQSGLTPPSKPWFRLRLAQRDLERFKPVRGWLDAVQKDVHEQFSRANLYAATHTCYEELGAFGTAALLLERDYDRPMRARAFTTGEFFLGLGSNWRPDLLYRRFSMTAYQMVTEYGKDLVSNAVRQAFEKNQWDKTWNVVQAIEPRLERSLRLQTPQHMPWKSVYFQEQADDKDIFLRQSGFHTKPFAVARWAVRGVDAYGVSPGMESLADTKLLQAVEKTGLEAGQKHVNPPMIAASKLRGKPVTTIAGGRTYADGVKGQMIWQPAFQTALPTQYLFTQLERIEHRINEAFYVHLFKSVSAKDKQMTAREVAELLREQLVLLGPVIERLQIEFLETLVFRAIDILMRLGRLPAPPPELRGMWPDVEFMGMLAAAQRATDTQAIDRLTEFVLAVAPLIAEAADFVDWQEAASIYADLHGVPPSIVRSKNEVKKIQRQRAEQMRAAAMAEQAASAAQTAKTLSETNVADEDTALSRLIGT